MAVAGSNNARAVVHARDGFLRHRSNSNRAVPVPETPPVPPVTTGPVHVGVPRASMHAESPASLRSHTAATRRSPTPSAGRSGRTSSGGGRSSLVSDSQQHTPAGHMSDISLRIDEQVEAARRDALQLQSELEQVEAEISRLSLLAHPGAVDPVQVLAESGAASAAAAGAGGVGIERTPLAARSHASRWDLYAQAPSVPARVPSMHHPVEREEFFVQHSVIVEKLQEFQRRMSTLDVAHVPVVHALNGRQPWHAARTIDQEIALVQQDIQSLLYRDGGGWVARQEFLAHVLHQVAELCKERPAHLRRLTGVAKVSLDNRFTRRVVDRLAQLLHEMNVEIITELRRETARDTAVAAPAFGASAADHDTTPPSHRHHPYTSHYADRGVDAALEQHGAGNVS